MRGGLMKIVIPRNTLIPAEGKATFTTIMANQSCIRSKILEGERKFAVENNLLGEMVISGVPKLPRGVPNVEFTFKVNADGILHVTAVEKTTGTKAETTIKYEQKRLNKNQLEDMVENAEKHREEDDERQKAIKAKNELEMLCSDIQDYGVYNKKLSEKGKQKVLNKCEGVLEWLEWIGTEPCDKSKYEAKMKELKDLFEAAK